ncbi:MAG: hypothetical protein MdMp014T_2898 [Treponematales bacterium]
MDFSALGRRVARGIEKAAVFAGGRLLALAARAPERARLPLAAAGTAALCAVFVLVWALSRPSAPQAEDFPAAPVVPAIPAGELFLPGEPDAAPPVLRGRERRKVWRAEDAGQFWTDPGNWDDGEAQTLMRREIDRFMETIQ